MKDVYKRQKENLILNAEEKSIQLEYELFSELRGIVKNEIPKIQQIAKVLAYFDVLQAFATMSEENRYTRPMLNKNHVIEIKDGRHPVVEKVLKDVQYVENDCIMPSDLSIPVSYTHLHTHVPTADERILTKGTAYITDVGMTGPLDGVIGVERENVINKFIEGLPIRFNAVEQGSAQLNAVLIEVNDKTDVYKRQIHHLQLFHDFLG